MHDDDMIGRIGYVDVSAEDPTVVIKVSDKPVLDIGRPGMFDDNGVTPASLVDHDGRLYLFYVGWQLGVKVRYYLFPGVAVSDDGGNTFSRVSEAPILDRVSGQEYMRTAPSVIKVGGVFIMWFVAGGEWIELEGKMVPKYNMYSMQSSHPVVWPKGPGYSCLDKHYDNEFGYGRPQVIAEDGIYKMFYSIRYRDIGYRLGYAESSNAYMFARKDSMMNIDVSDSGWDSESLSFSSIVDYKDKRYMFYNGSHGGRTGVGVAVMNGRSM